MFVIVYECGISSNKATDNLCIDRHISNNPRATLTVDFVGSTQAGDLRPIFPKFLKPRGQILVRNFPSDIEYLKGEMLCGEWFTIELSGAHKKSIFVKEDL